MWLLMRKLRKMSMENNMNLLMRAIFSLFCFLLSLFLSFLTVLQWPLKALQIYDAAFLNGFTCRHPLKRAVVDKRSLG